MITEVFFPIFLKIYRALMRWTPWSFFGEVAVMSPQDGGTHSEWGVESRGMRALSQILSDEFIFFIKTNGSTHITFHGGALISNIYISCFHDDVIIWKHVPCHWLLCREFSGDCGKLTSHRWIPLTQISDAELWCCLCSAPEQTVE